MADPNDLLSSEGLDSGKPVAGLDLLPEQPGPLKAGFGSGVAGVKSNLYGAGALAAHAVSAVTPAPISDVATGLEQAALRESAAQGEIAAEGARRIEDVDWTSPSSVANHFKYLLGNAVPSLALMFAGGTIGRGFGALAGRALPSVALPLRVGGSLAEAAKGAGALLGAVAPDVALEAGGIYPEALKTGVENPALRAAAGGAAAAALDFAPILAAERYLKPIGKGGVGAVLKGAAKGAPVGAALEGTQELGQAIIERAAAGQDLTGPDAMSDYINSFAGGAAPGSLFGAGIGARRGMAPPVASLSPLPPVAPPPAVESAASATPEARPAAPLSPEDAESIAHANLVTAHDAASEQATALDTQVKAAQAEHATITERLGALKVEERLPVGERRTKAEIIVERKGLAKQALALKAGIETLGGQLHGAKDVMAKAAPQIAELEKTMATRDLLAKTPTQMHPDIQERAPAVESDIIADPNRPAPSTAEQIDNAVRGVHAIFREQGMPLTTTRESLATPPLGRREAALARVAEQNAPKETIKGPSAAQMAAVEPHAMAVIEPMAKQLADAKGQTPGAKAKLQIVLGGVMRDIVQEAAKTGSVAEAQAHIVAKLPAALKGHGVSADVDDIAKAISTAVGQATTQFSKGAIKAPTEKESRAAISQDEFDVLPREGKERVVDEYNRIMTAKGVDLREHLRQLIGNDPNLTVTTFQAQPGSPIGSYTRVDKLKSIVALALNAKNGLSVADHEGFHYAEDQLLDSRERAVIRAALRPGSAMYQQVLAKVQQYDLENGTKLADEVAGSAAEAHAYAFEFWRRGELKAEGLLNQVFEKIAEMLRAVARFVTGQGFSMIEDIFAALDRGQIAERARTENAGIGEVGFRNAFNAPDGTPMLSQDARATWYKSALAEQVGLLPIKSAPAQGWKDQIKGLVAKGLVKQAEIDAVGLDEWLSFEYPAGKAPKISRDEIMTFLREQGVQVEEVLLGAKTIPNTKYDEYQLPGGTNYRELLLTLPTENPFQLPAGWKVEPWMNAETGDRHRFFDGPAADLWQVLDAEGTQRGIGNNEEDAVRDAGAGAENGQRLHKAQPIKFTAPHFGEHGKNLLAHVRFNERTDAGGKRVLFLEELQSDWGQKGKKEGFLRVKNPYDVFDSRSGNVIAKFATVDEARVDAINRGVPYDYGRSGDVPEAPFVGNTEAWVGLVMKRMVRYALENGFDSIAWTTGEQQVQRYNSALQKRVDSIEWTKTADGVHLVGYKGTPSTSLVSGYHSALRIATATIRRNDNLGFDNLHDALSSAFEHRADWEERWGDGLDAEDRADINNYIDAQLRQNKLVGSRVKVVDTTEKESSLSDAIGKAMADRIRKDTAQSGVIEGSDITVSDTGMAAFYEKIVPNVVNDVLKKLGGGKVGEVKVDVGGGGALTYFKNGANSLYGAPGTYNIHLAGGGSAFNGITFDRLVLLVGQEKAAAIAADIGHNPANNNWYSKAAYDFAGHLGPEPKAQPGFTIAPAMVEKVLAGLPLFSRGAAEYTTPHIALPAYGHAKANSVATPAVHFSPTAGITRLTSERYGTGIKGAEASRVAASVDARLKQRLHFYVPQGYGVAPEKGVGANAYGVTLANLYDADADPLRIWANGGESAILDAGFDGYLAREFSTAVLLGKHSVPVVSLGTGEAAANAQLGAFSAPPAVYDQARILAEDLIHDKRLPGGAITPAEWRTVLAAQAPDLLARLPRNIFEGTAPVYRDQLIRAFYRNAPVDITGDGLAVALQGLNPAQYTQYSRGAVIANAAMDRQSAEGELQQAQLFQASAKMMESAMEHGSDNLGKLALGALNTEVSGGISRWWQKNIATPNFTSRLSNGYKNVFRVLNTYVRYRNELVERMLIQKIPLWYKASTEDQDVAFAALNKRNVEGLTGNSQELRDIMVGLNEKQRAMFVSATQMFEGFLRKELEADKPFYQRVYKTAGEYEKWLANRTDQVNGMIDKGYMPLRRYGDHTVHVYLESQAPDGRPVKLSGALEFFGTARGAYSAAKIYEEEIKRSGAQLKVEVGTHYKAARDTTISPQQFLDTARRNGVPLAADEQERLVKALSSADSLTRNRMLHREGMPGYSKDGMRVINEFGMRMSGKLAYAQFASAIDAASDGRAVDSDVVDGDAVIKIDELRGEPGATESKEDFNARNLWKLEGPMSGFHHNLADELADYVLVPDHTGGWSRKLRGAAMMYFIGGSLSGALVNTMSVPMMVVPELSVHTNYMNAASTTLGAWTTTWRYQHILRNIERLKSTAAEDAIPGVDAGLRQALIEAAQYTMDTELHQIMGISQGALFSQNQGVQRAMKAWMAPFQVSEQTNRITSFIAAYKVASTGEGVRQADGSFKRLSGQELFNFARGVIDSTQNNYNETNRPGAARNPVYALMMMFKSFPLFMTEAIALMYKANPKSAVFMLLGLTAMTGVQGLPFAETIEDLIDTIAQQIFGSPFNTRRAMRNTIKSASDALIGYDLSELVLRGGINAVLGVSASSRIGAGDFVPGTRLGTADGDQGKVLESFLGAPYAMVKEAAANAGKFAGGVFTGDWKETADALRAGGPIAVRNTIKGVEQLSDGYASDAKGRKLIDVTSVDAMLQMAGVSSAGLARAYELEKINHQVKAFYTQVSGDMQNQLVRAMKDNDAEKVQEISDLRNAWNKQYPEMPLMVNSASVRRDLALSGIPMDRRSMLMWGRRIRGNNMFNEQ